MIINQLLLVSISRPVHLVARSAVFPILPHHERVPFSRPAPKQELVFDPSKQCD